MAKQIENILQNLLTPDSLTIKQSTKQLMDYFASEKCVHGFLEIVKSSQNIQLRIYASNLLRRKAKNWKHISENEKAILKDNIINVLLNESDESVRKHIVLLIATYYKHCVKSNCNWPELLEFINSFVLSADKEKHLFGMFVLNILIEECAEEMKQCYESLIKIFLNILNDGKNFKSTFFSINCLNHMIRFINRDQESSGLENICRSAINITINLVKADQSEETVSAVLGLFQSFIEYEMTFLSKHVSSLTFVMLALISDTSLSSSNRITFTNFLNVLIETQKSLLLKYEMIKPITDFIFSTICESSEQLQMKSKLETDLLEGEKLDESELDQSDNLFSSACQVLDYCALYFPAKKLIPIVIEFASINLANRNPLNRRAALAAFAITCEGCADFYKSNYTEILVNACLKGMQDFDSSVVQISYFALSQFSEFLQPKIIGFSDKFMKLFIESIETKLEIRCINRLTLRFYGALQSFCESLGDELEQYLPTLMSKLMTLEILCSASLKIKRLILSTFASIISSVKNKFDPYFEYVFQLIKPHIQLDFQSLEPQSKFIQIECIQLMAVLAQNISKDVFNSILIENSLLLIHNALSDEIDPEIKSVAYHLFAALSNKLNERLPIRAVLPHILETLRSEEGVCVVDSEAKSNNDLLSQFDEIDLEESENENEELNNAKFEDYENNVYDESKNLLVENEYVSEKLSAIYCIQEIAKYKNEELCEFYEECFLELKRLINFVNINVRKEAYLSLAHLISFYYNFHIKSVSSVEQNCLEKFKEYFLEYLQKSMKTIELDLNREIVMNVFNSIKILFNQISPDVRQNVPDISKQLETLTSLVLNTFKNKIYCQTINQSDALNEFEDEAEYDFIVKQYAGDVLPSIAICIDQKVFGDYFKLFVVYLINLIENPNTSFNQKSFAIGLIGEIAQNLESIDVYYAQKFFPIFYQYLFADDDELRSNVIYSIGILFSHSNHSLSPYYSRFLSDLYKLIQEEKSKLVLDNICGTMARLFVCLSSTNTQTIDYGILAKTIFDLTPLKSDVAEYSTVFWFILQTTSNRFVLPFYPKIIELSLKVLNIDDNELKKNTKQLVISFLKHTSQNYTNDFNTFLNQLEKNSRDLIIQTVLN